ncbi:hypothetical protein IFM89_010440 [Coptis chinensis]|uniref:Uncharacterized protein n=1 Tax=Coptis chinensis TaxID=261450 RepID=A0A835HZP5_9MAGN|nr:hypothetical protein IFM89_010440 [Coptis chinensis]
MGISKVIFFASFTQIAIGTDDVYKTAAAIKLYGGGRSWELVPCPASTQRLPLAWIPDGWKSVNKFDDE